MLDASSAGACPGIDHRNMMRRIEQALVLVLAAQIHHHANALRKLAHTGDASVNLHSAAALGRKTALHDEASVSVRAVKQARLDASPAASPSAQP